MLHITEPKVPGDYNKRKMIQSPQVDPKHTPQ